MGRFSNFFLVYFDLKDQCKKAICEILSQSEACSSCKKVSSFYIRFYLNRGSFYAKPSLEKRLISHFKVSVIESINTFLRKSICVCCSMAIHPSLSIVASGQRSGRHRRSNAHVRVWSALNLTTLHVFGIKDCQVGISTVAFSVKVN